MKRKLEVAFSVGFLTNLPKEVGWRMQSKQLFCNFRGAANHPNLEWELTSDAAPMYCHLRRQLGYDEAIGRKVTLTEVEQTLHAASELIAVMTGRGHGQSQMPLFGVAA